MRKFTIKVYDMPISDCIFIPVFDIYMDYADKTTLALDGLTMKELINLSEQLRKNLEVNEQIEKKNSICN